MKKSYFLGVFVIGVLLGVGITFLIMNKNDKEVATNITEDSRDESSSTEDVKDSSWSDTVHAEMLDDWEVGEKWFDERLVQKMMLDMIHDKVKHVDINPMEITSKRIDSLLQIVEEEKAVFMHYQSYMDILNRWEKGDFSTSWEDDVLLHSFYYR